MKLNLILSLLFISLFIGCNKSNKNDFTERHIYKTQHDEIVSLKIKDSTFTLSWIIFGSKETKKKVPILNIKDQLNIYCLIEYDGKIKSLKNKRQFNLVRMTLNSVKMSDGKNIKAPVDTGHDFSFNDSTKNITFNGETLSVNDYYSTEKVIKLINDHQTWDGQEIRHDELK